ncbi:Procollagen C-endopeptidase enhancer 1 [Holothuria leucospilota]|uniref:Procollagen C-endopeptidase enhancer 1 n=1 Tax=Holothuria leucospilota TaxID=206669 RepID=A0A9Q1BD70_HOLLE|nr:Procollagen C-endopeptidase enhancer 1 [Holothuria leucospilota]
MEVIALLLIMGGILSSEASLEVRHTYIDRSGASISSPNFPRDYNNNERCTYHVVAPIGSVVMLYFNHLDIEGNLYREEYHDVLEVKHWDASTTFTRKLCGFNVPSPIYSLGNEMNLTFQTDSVTTASGFHASVYFLKSTNPYFPTDGVYASLRILMAVNVAVGIIIVFLVVSCVVLYKRNLLQINLPVRTQEKKYSPILSGESSTPHPGAASFDIKDGSHDASKETPPSPETSQGRYLEMKPSFKKNKITIKHEKYMKEPVDTPEGEYACPLTDEIQNVAHKRNTVEYSVPSDVDVIDTNIYQTNTAIPKSEYSHTVIEKDENSTIQDPSKGIFFTPEAPQCYLEMKSGLKETNKPRKYSEEPVISTYGDTESPDTRETIYAAPIIKPPPDVSKKRNTVEYSEPYDVDTTGSNTSYTNIDTRKSEYSKAIIERDENTSAADRETEGGKTESMN